MRRAPADIVLPSYLRNLRLLTPHDDEFQQVGYLLRASLASLSANILTVHAINSPHQDGNWEGSNIGNIVLDSWVNSKDLPEGNTIPQIIAHGGQFRIPNPDQGAIFSVGVIPLDDDQQQQGLASSSSSSGPRRYEMLLCRIAVGRSFVVDPRQIGAHGIPAGYSSIAIHKPDDAAATSADPNQGQNGGTVVGAAPYFREYILNDESRIYPKYVVSFIFDPAKDRIKAVPLCESCNTRGASVFCIQDNAKLCDQCDHDLHNQNRIQAKHQRVQLSQMQQQVGTTMCEEHPSMPVEYYDIVAHIPVCVQCRMKGSHSTGEYSRHKLVPIGEAFQKSIADLDEERRWVEKRRNTIRAQLSALERKMSEVNENHEKCQEQLMKIVQEAVQAIHEETQSKLSALLSDETELKRQMEFFGWLEAFLNYQRSCSTPVEFLQAFKNQSTLLARAPSEIVDNAAGVKPTMKIVGRVEIIVDDDAVQDLNNMQAAANAGGNQQQQQGPKSALKNRGGFNGVPPAVKSSGGRY